MLGADGALATGGFPPGAGGVIGAGGSPDGGSTDPPTFAPVADFTAPGPFPTTSEPGGTACTMYRPTTLGEGGLLHPIVVWGNGTFTTPVEYDALLSHFASHGFIVAAANTSDAGSGREMVGCLDYVIAQNESSGSPYAAHADTMHVAAAGYSQGGAGCLAAGLDPRFTATLPVSPFIVLPLGGYDPTSVARQIHPMFMLSGDLDIVAAPVANQQPIFDQAPVPIFWAMRAGVGHLEVQDDGKSYRGPMTAWFRYKLMNDPAAAAWFQQETCTLCTAPEWTVQRNALWTE